MATHMSHAKHRRAERKVVEIAGKNQGDDLTWHPVAGRATIDPLGTMMAQPTAAAKAKEVEDPPGLEKAEGVRRFQEAETALSAEAGIFAGADRAGAAAGTGVDRDQEGHPKEGRSSHVQPARPVAMGSGPRAKAVRRRGRNFKSSRPAWMGTGISPEARSPATSPKPPKGILRNPARLRRQGQPWSSPTTAISALPCAQGTVRTGETGTTVATGGIQGGVTATVATEVTAERGRSDPTAASGGTEWSARNVPSAFPPAQECRKFATRWTASARCSSRW